ncbi:MAG: hypothetical protein QOD72_1349 [Acidimicrobiaceae bacterium]|jgi:hypothetical protein|nr:hypothetical protein [Acidimicrobiaceae bacterium]
MDDTDIVEEINRLAAHEHELEQRAARTPLSDDERAELTGVEVQLDQCWDLLRQRRARRHAGQDPDEAHVRAAEIVEHYQQ